MDERIRQLLAIGTEHYEAREFVPAEPYLRQVAEALPDFADVQNMLGVTFYQQGKYELAREAFERALKVNPRYTEAALNLAVTYNELGSYTKSRKVHESVAPTPEECLDPFVRGKIANMHAEIACAYEDYRVHGEAIKQYREALALCPTFADLRTQLGDVLRDSGDVAAAVAEYRQAKVDNPEYVPARVHLGMALFILGENDEALSEWEEALKLDPDNRLAQTSLRMVRSTRGTDSEPPQAVLEADGLEEPDLAGDTAATAEESDAEDAEDGALPDTGRDEDDDP